MTLDVSQMTFDKRDDFQRKSIAEKMITLQANPRYESMPTTEIKSQNNEL